MDTEKFVNSIIEEATSKEKKSKLTFSKLLCLLIVIMTGIVMCAALICVFIFQDTEPLSYLIPSVFAEASVISGFYSYKAKAENKMKLEIKKMLVKKALGGEIDDDDEDSDMDEED